ncbi:MAG: phage Gp19/Gp15/Gp42 family protein [Propionibacteriaceae bacterium]|jgi:hypothetical protein|nr:phage Gp19/Gp15/Gp42 family protein [Propionibacteriaceae bacterium]
MTTPQPFATADDLEAGWRPLGPAERDRATVLLGRASRDIRARVPDLDARIASGRLDPNLAADVACAMVQRAMAVPADQAGVTQQSETFNGFTQSQTFANPAGNLYLLDSETAKLRGPGRAFTIDLLPERRPA